MGASVIPRWVYLLVAGTLLALTAVTVAVAQVDLGPWNAVVAVTIAVVKGLLVVLYFMHARYGDRLTWVYVGAAVVWLVILIGLTYSDYLGRAWLPPPEGWSRQ